MDINQLFYTDPNNDDEVSFILELASLLQKEFQQNIRLKIHTNRDLSHVINKYLWNSKPTLVTSGPDSSDVYIDLAGNQPSFEARAYILSSETSKEGANSFKVPSHLLKSELNSDEIQSAKVYSVAKVILERKFSSDNPSKKITLFYSDELREWLSLVEASEGLISFWYRQRDESTELELINLSHLKGPGVLKKVAFTSDRIVILKITPKSSQVVKSLRILNPECPLTIHGFESASVFFANTFLYGAQEYLKDVDLWIFSCETDEGLARLAWEKINAVVKPLKFPVLHKNIKVVSSRKNLLFFGRITEQKNLHEGLFAVKILEDKMREENRKFKIFGYEDFLGVPNLRVPSLGYLEYLFKLAHILKIADLVEFHPAIPVEKMMSELENGVFFSPSVHSDENFGLVAFRSLNSGVPAVLSHWGGHQEFKKFFAPLSYFSVYQTEKGPKCNPFEMASVILKTWSDDSSPKVIQSPDLSLPEASPGKAAMKPSGLKNEIESRIDGTFPWQVRKWPLYGKLFRNYGDQKYQLTLKTYGALKMATPGVKNAFLSPEVEILDSELKVLDCRAGVLRYPRIEEIQDRRVKKLDNSEVCLSQSEWSWLWENGYIYSRESYEL